MKAVGWPYGEKVTAPMAGDPGCMFCGQSPLTREHVVPVWLSEVLADAFPSGDGYDIAYEWTTEEATSPLRAYSVPAPEVVVRAVCEGCNNGWMSALEAEVMGVLRPMVRGEVISVDLDEQVTLARWASKVAVLLDHYAEGSVILSPGDLDTIRSMGSAPDGYIVRLAYREANVAHDTPLNILMATALASRVDDSPPDSASAGPNAFVATIAVGHVAVSVCGGPGVVNPERWRDGTYHALTAWPPTPTGLSWPPLHPRLADADDLKRFHEAAFLRMRNPDFPRPDPTRRGRLGESVAGG